MRKLKAVMGAVLSLAALTLILGTTPAQADVVLSLTVGSSYSSVGGGSFDPSTLGGTSLLYMYCLSIGDHITPGGVYDVSKVNNYGEVDHASNSPSTPPNPFQPQPANSIAWLLTNVASLAYPPSYPDFPAPGGQGAYSVVLQEAIWKLIYGRNTLYGTSSSTIDDAAKYLYDQAVGQSGPVEDFLWISPKKSSTPGVVYQAQVAKSSIPVITTPEPLGFLLLGLMMSLTAGAVTLRKRV